MASFGVFLKELGSCKESGAHLALKGALFAVELQVYLDVAALRERLGAQRALVGLFARVEA